MVSPPEAETVMVLEDAAPERSLMIARRPFAGAGSSVIFSVPARLTPIMRSVASIEYVAAVTLVLGLVTTEAGVCQEAPLAAVESAVRTWPLVPTASLPFPDPLLKIKSPLVVVGARALNPVLAVFCPVPPRAIGNCPEVTMDAGKEGISPGTRARNEGAPVVPSGEPRNLFCKVVGSVVIARVPELVTGEPVVINPAGTERPTLVTPLPDAPSAPLNPVGATG